MARYYLKHYGMVSSDDFDEPYLAHHGIEGMRWGIKNGPPYPLSDAKHDKVISKSVDSGVNKKELKSECKRIGFKVGITDIHKVNHTKYVSQMYNLPMSVRYSSRKKDPGKYNFDNIKKTYDKLEKDQTKLENGLAQALYFVHGISPIFYTINSYNGIPINVSHNPVFISKDGKRIQSQFMGRYYESELSKRPRKTRMAYEYNVEKNSFRLLRDGVINFESSDGKMIKLDEAVKKAGHDDASKNVQIRHVDESYLAHYGIQGQKWGVKNGPPYPLSEYKHDVVLSKSGGGNSYVDRIVKERDKHKPYTKAERRGLRQRGPFDPIKRKEKEVLKKEKEYVKERNKNAEYDPKAHMYKKRKNTTADEDLAIVNIKKESKGSGAHNNCVLCSIAYELRRRGFDVLANNAIVGYVQDEYFKAFKGMKVNSEMTRLVTKGDKTVAIDEKKYLNGIAKAYGKLPDNSRGIATIKWCSPRDPRITQGGHAICWEKTNGVFKMLDGQVDKKFSQGDELNKLLSHTNLVQFMRVDNLEPDYEYIQKMGFVKGVSYI